MDTGKRIDHCLSTQGGHLYVEQCDRVELIREFGSPLFVLSEDQIRRNVRRLQEAFQDDGPEGPLKVLPAAKLGGWRHKCSGLRGLCSELQSGITGRRGKMARIWSRPIGISDLGGPDYWDYFGVRLVEHAAIPLGAKVLDVGCGTGSSLFPAAEKTGASGYAIGIDICPS